MNNVITTSLFALSSRWDNAMNVTITVNSQALRNKDGGGYVRLFDTMPWRLCC